MKFTAALALVLLTFSAALRAEGQDDGQTQTEMTAQAAQEFRAADEALNRVYRTLRDAQEPEGATRLKAAQKAWITYRDAEADFEAGGNDGGTLAPLARLLVKTRLTEARSAELQSLLTGSDDPNQ